MEVAPKYPIFKSVYFPNNLDPFAHFEYRTISVNLKRCLGTVLRVPGRCLNGGWTLSGWCLDLFGKLSVQNECIKIVFYAVPQTTSYLLGMSWECLKSSWEGSGWCLDLIGMVQAPSRCWDATDINHKLDSEQKHFLDISLPATRHIKGSLKVPCRQYANCRLLDSLETPSRQPLKTTY